MVVVAQGCLFLGRHYGRSFKEPAGIGAGAGAAHALVGGDTSVTRNSCTTGFDVEGGLGASKQSCLFRSLVYTLFRLLGREETRARSEKKQKTQATNLRFETNFLRETVVCLLRCCCCCCCPISRSLGSF